jgi:hypothetical protein
MRHLNTNDPRSTTHHWYVAGIILWLSTLGCESRRSAQLDVAQLSTWQAVSLLGFGAERTCYYAVAMRRAVGDTTLTRRGCVQVVVNIHKEELGHEDLAAGSRMFSMPLWGKVLGAMRDSTTVVPYCPEDEEKHVDRVARRIAQLLPVEFVELLDDLGLGPPDVLISLSLARSCHALNAADLSRLADVVETPTAGRYVTAAIRALAAIAPAGTLPRNSRAPN